MKIFENIKIRDFGLYLENYKTLIISDIHIGYEDSLTKKGFMIPKVHFKEFLSRLSNMLVNVDTVVINGDLKHDFGGISSTEYKESKELFDLLKGKKIILNEGNHDPVLKFLVKDIIIQDYCKVGDVLICHGDKIVNEESKIIIIGHEHAAVGLKEGMRVEKYKCFLKGKYKSKTLIVMPSCNLVVEGTDVIRENKLSPYLQGSLDNFEVFVISDKVYEFGQLKGLKFN